VERIYLVIFLQWVYFEKKFIIYETCKFAIENYEKDALSDSMFTLHTLYRSITKRFCRQGMRSKSKEILIAEAVTGQNH